MAEKSSKWIAQVCADRELIGTMGQLYLFAAQEVALIEIAVIPGFVFTAGAGNVNTLK